MKIPPVGAELFLADRQTDITMLTVTFQSFAKTPKNRHKTLMIILTNVPAVVIVQV
jgi:hypothetical protein